MENIYLIYGENKYKIDQHLKKIIDLNSDVVKYDMFNFSLNEALIDLSTQPLFSDKKIIVCENCCFLTGNKMENISDDDILKLFKYLENKNHQNTLILVVNSKTLDERKKIVKKLKEVAKTIYCSVSNYNDMFIEIKETFEKNGFQISKEDIKFLIERVNKNEMVLNNEIQKLLLYKKDEKEITLEDIKEIVSKEIEDDVFVLIEKLINKEKKEAFEIYYQLLKKGEEPIKIMVIFANQIRLIYQVKILIDKGLEESEIASSLKIHPYRIKLAKENTYKFSNKQLKKYLLDLANLDLQIKTGKINKSLGLELFIAQM